VKYFFDNCISYKLSNMLRALDVDAEALRERFPPNIKDLALFPQLQGQRNFTLISVDTSQLTRDTEARELRRTGIRALYFEPFFQKRKFWQQAVWLLNKWHLISGFAEGCMPGTIAAIKQNGKADPYRF